MTKTFYIGGFIVDDESSSTSFEDVRPSQIKSFIENLEPEDEIELTINSFGGSVSAGLAICNLLKEASKNGHKITTHVLGFACSTASFIACSGSRLRIDSTAFLMIHNPYTWIEGNANDLRKEALVLDKMKESIIEIYRSKFKLDENEISQWMDSETWIKGSEASEILNCEVIPTEKEKEEPFEIIIDKNKNRFLNRIHSLPENVKFIDSKPTVEEEEEPKEEPKEEKPVEEEKTITLNECEKRISGIQSALQKQMNIMKTEYADKIENLTNELKEKEQKLVDAESETISLKTTLEKTEKELAEKTINLEEKQIALETLNSQANQLPDDKPKIDWRNLKGEAFFDYLKQHPELVKGC